MVLLEQMTKAPCGFVVPYLQVPRFLGTLQAKDLACLPSNHVLPDSMHRHAKQSGCLNSYGGLYSPRGEQRGSTSHVHMGYMPVGIVNGVDMGRVSGVKFMATSLPRHYRSSRSAAFNVLRQYCGIYIVAVDVDDPLRRAVRRRDTHRSLKANDA